MYVIVMDTEGTGREVWLTTDEPGLRDTDELLQDFGAGQTKLTVHRVIPGGINGDLTYTYEGKV